MNKLNEIEVGKTVVVKNLKSTGALRERMLAIGLTKGCKVIVIGRGPSNDPTIYNIRGAFIALRKEEASLIEVE